MICKTYICWLFYPIFPVCLFQKFRYYFSKRGGLCCELVRKQGTKTNTFLLVGGLVVVFWNLYHCGKKKENEKPLTSFSIFASCSFVEPTFEFSFSTFLFRFFFVEKFEAKFSRFFFLYSVKRFSWQARNQQLLSTFHKWEKTKKEKGHKKKYMEVDESIGKKKKTFFPKQKIKSQKNEKVWETNEKTSTWKSGTVNWLLQMLSISVNLNE